MTKIYGLKNCDTSRKAAKALGGTLVDVREEPLTRAQLEHFYARFGDALVNRRSTSWRNLDEEARRKEPIALLLAHPTLMKRPVILFDGELFLGWGRDVQDRLLG